MKRAAKLFTDHPATVGETWGQHFLSAVSFAGPLFIASLCCLVHALFPFAFEKTGSRIVRGLYHRMVTHRARAPHNGRPLADWSDYSI